MGLYEINTGHVGESYERCYAWVESEHEAREFFEEKRTGREIREIHLLFKNDSKPFITLLSDSGWDAGNV